MTFATQADVEALLVRSLTDTELQALPRLLELIDGRIMGRLPGVKFDGVVTGAVVTLRGNGPDELWLPGRPVVAVSSVSIDGEVLDPSEWAVSRWGPLRRHYGAWGGRRAEIQVTWDYGLDAPPDDVVEIAADLARWAIANPTNVRQATIGSYSETVGGGSPAGIELLPQHLRTLGRYRARATSVAVVPSSPWWGTDGSP